MVVFCDGEELQGLEIAKELTGCYHVPVCGRAEFPETGEIGVRGGGLAAPCGGML